jgi:hypothetical protein
VGKGKVEKKEGGVSGGGLMGPVVGLYVYGKEFQPKAGGKLLRVLCDSGEVTGIVDFRSSEYKNSLVGAIHAECLLLLLK